ncbi:unnamed protein product [Acanthoscelides obtectus]|uniref:Uncharacterized protein n=1 Tax=Acanthoscelides obtectus TaxID=200917 RepID=A0A9P0KJG8_ACAOB|nr:unnamed protein product [Acanthoscelides obtectus]CAK1675288.1 hypothetical protein AOBTE_LOCUS30110 [Acanthoscelides obtectus]
MITLYSRGYPPRRSKRLTGICIFSDTSWLVPACS